MTTTFAELDQKFGIQNKPVSDSPSFDELTDAFVDAVFEEMEMEIPEEPTDQDIEDINLVLEHAAMTISTNLENSQWLAQWGVLGMKWGRRKQADGTYRYNARRQAGNHPGHGEGGDKINTASENREARSASTVRKASELSNEELNAVINRFRLEQQYNQIMTPSAPKNVLLDATKDVLAKAAKKTVQKYADDAAAALGKAVADYASNQLKKARASK